MEEDQLTPLQNEYNLPGKRSRIQLSLEKITESVYQINGGQGANGGVIITESEVLVIDAKMFGRESDWDEPEFYPFTPSLSFKKNLNMWLGKEKVELYYFGVGHTTGDIVIFHPEQKVAFIGDLYFSGRPQLIHSNKNGNSFKYVKTMMQMLKKLDAEIFLSGHSDPVGREEIEKHIQLMVERQNKVKEFVSQDKSLEEILTEFNENKDRQVTSIYNEITEQESIQSTENLY